MTQGKRFGLSAAQKSDMWCRWKAGQSLHEIGRAFGKPHTSIRCLVSRYSGIVPAVRRRSLLALTLREREEISRGIASGSSIREIAKGLDRTVSTVSREVARHGGRSVYRANQADCEARESALRPKRCLLSIHVELQKLVASKLILDWSPEQISGWLKTQYPEDESLRVSHETIYRSLFIQARLLSMSRNLSNSEQNRSGGGCPKLTNRKWPEGCTSPYSMVATSREYSSSLLPRTLRAVASCASRRLILSKSSGVVFPRRSSSDSIKA